MDSLVRVFKKGNFTSFQLVYGCLSVYRHNVASFPGLPHFFVLRFALSIIHGSGKALCLPLLCIILNAS